MSQQARRQEQQKCHRCKGSHHEQTCWTHRKPCPVCGTKGQKVCKKGNTNKPDQQGTCNTRSAHAANSTSHGPLPNVKSDYTTLDRRLQSILKRCNNINLQVGRHSPVRRKDNHQRRSRGEQGGHTSPHRIPQANNKKQTLRVHPTRGAVSQRVTVIQTQHGQTQTTDDSKKAFEWEEQHTRDFVNIRDMLTSRAEIHPFDRAKETTILTSASRLYRVTH